MINEPPQPQTDAERLAVLRDAAETAYCFLELYCNCPSRNIPAKTLRIALKVTT